MFGMGRYLYGLCGRVASAVRGVFVSDPSGTLPTTHDSLGATAEQLQHEERRKQANADRFYSNGFLVETVPDQDADGEDTEAQITTAQCQEDIPDPYQDKNRMSTVMEPVE
jgi:hypothetical protein